MRFFFSHTIAIVLWIACTALVVMSMFTQSLVPVLQTANELPLPEFPSASVSEKFSGSETPLPEASSAKENEVPIKEQPAPASLQTAPSSVPSIPPVATISFTLQLQGKEHIVTAPAGSTVYDGMRIAQEKGYLSFEAREFSSIGFFVEAINGIRNDYKNGMYWIYSINGTKAHVGVSSYVLQPNDIIFWNYEPQEA